MVQHLGVIAQSTLEKDQAYANQISAAVDDQSLQQQQACACPVCASPPLPAHL